MPVTIVVGVVVLVGLVVNTVALRGSGERMRQLVVRTLLEDEPPAP